MKFPSIATTLPSFSSSALRTSAPSWIGQAAFVAIIGLLSVRSDHEFSDRRAAVEFLFVPRQVLGLVSTSHAIDRTCLQETLIITMKFQSLGPNEVTLFTKNEVIRFTVAGADG
jgi:hypothetical protein